MKPQLSICLPIRNRTNVRCADGGMVHLLPRCIDSIRQAVLESGVTAEIVVADYHSTDTNLKEWLPQAAIPIPATIVFSDDGFTIGGGKNLAAENSQSDTLFFCEADMIIPTEFITRGMAVTAEGKGYFPFYQRFKNQHTDEKYWGNGHGVCVVRREHWINNKWFVGAMWHGDEDTKFAHFFMNNGLRVREQLLGFYHQWHPLCPAKAAEDLKSIAEGRPWEVMEQIA